MCTHLFETPPFTLVHHDFDGENLFFSVDGQLSVAVIDWQVTTRARGPLDVASLSGSQCEPLDRSKRELDLLQMYHRLLVEQGVSDYGFDQCWDNYRLSKLVAMGRTSASVGLNRAGLGVGRGTRSFLGTARPSATPALPSWSPPCSLIAVDCERRVAVPRCRAV